MHIYIYIYTILDGKCLSTFFLEGQLTVPPSTLADSSTFLAINGLPQQSAGKKLKNTVKII